MVPADRVKENSITYIGHIMATYAIGDIQGCYDELRQLLAKINFKSDCDKLWFTGDLVNRGPQSADVLRYIMGLGDSVKCVLGNHDLNLLAVATGKRDHKMSDTLEDILNASDSEEMLNWLRHRPLFHRSKEHRTCMVHAGVHP